MTNNEPDYTNTKFAIDTGKEVLTFHTEEGARIAARWTGSKYIGAIKLVEVIILEPSPEMAKRSYTYHKNGLTADGKPDMRLAANRHLKGQEDVIRRYD